MMPGVAPNRSGVVGRGARYLTDHGVVATTRVVLGAVRARVYVDEAHAWYSLDLAGFRAAAPLPDGMRLVRATDAHLASYVELGAASAASTRARLDAGANLWLVTEGPRPAFACWTFAHATPVEAARGGSLRLPEHCVCLEDSVTAPAFRGRGIAPAAWSALAKHLREEAFTLMVTKVGLANAPSRRAVSKAGFAEFAIMRHRRLARRRRVEVWPHPGVPGIDLAEALPARVGAPPVAA
jgi:GNAT superfamily N-acetyltransferase